LSVEVSDDGKGIPIEKRISMAQGVNRGVGLSGMRERVRELGGTLEIQSSENGTSIRAALPIVSPVAVSV
jgi:two-component system, NarL family, sensor kinase